MSPSLTSLNKTTQGIIFLLSMQALVISLQVRPFFICKNKLGFFGVSCEVAYLIGTNCTLVLCCPSTQPYYATWWMPHDDFNFLDKFDWTFIFNRDAIIQMVSMKKYLNNIFRQINHADKNAKITQLNRNGNKICDVPRCKAFTKFGVI